MHIPAATLFTLSLCLAGHAQEVFVVGGPGADFADLPEAVLAVASGDILDVVPGSYTGFTTDKGIHILGRPGGVTITRTGTLNEPSFGLVRLPRGERFTLRNVTLADNGIFRNIVRFCEGDVALEQVDGRWELDRCANVRMTECTATNMQTPLNVIASNVALDRCVITSQPILFNSPAIVASFSKLTVADCIVRALSVPQGPGSSAIRCSNPCELILTGSAQESILQAGSGGDTTPVAAVDGPMATAIVDSGLKVFGANNGPAFAPGILTTMTSVPTVRVDGAPLGGAVQVQLDGPAGEIYLMAFGLSAPPRQIAGFLGEFWLAFPTADSMGVIPNAGQVNTTTMVPNDPALLGLQVSWQSITTFANELPRFSHPSSFTVRM